MLKCKRKPIGDNFCEPWLDFHKRSLRAATAIIQRAGINILTALHDLKQSWAAHIARFGIGPREAQPLKLLLAWRPLSWWHDQVMYNDLRWNIVRHSPSQGRPMRWEQQISTNWMTILADIDNSLHLSLVVPPLALFKITNRCSQA